jgi:hypothetical protein
MQGGPAESGDGYWHFIFAKWFHTKELPVDGRRPDTRSLPLSSIILTDRPSQSEYIYSNLRLKM